MVKQDLTRPSRCGASRAGGQLTADKGKRTGRAGWCAGAHVRSPGQRRSVGVGERWPKLGCDCCMAVRTTAPGEKCLLRNQRREGIRVVLYERQP